MPVFTYRAADRRGQTIDGVMEAVDARAVAEQLRKDSYFPIKVAPQSERSSLLSLGGGSSRVRHLQPGRAGLSGMLSFATRQVIGRHRIAVIRRTGTAPDGMGSRRAWMRVQQNRGSRR